MASDFLDLTALTARVRSSSTAVTNARVVPFADGFGNCGTVSADGPDRVVVPYFSNRERGFPPTVGLVKWEVPGGFFKADPRNVGSALGADEEEWGPSDRFTTGLDDVEGAFVALTLVAFSLLTVAAVGALTRGRGVVSGLNDGANDIRDAFKALRWCGWTFVLLCCVPETNGAVLVRF